MQVVFFTINFIVFVSVLVFLLKKPVSKYLKDRKASFVNGNIDAKKHYDEALLRLNKIKEDVRDIDKNGRIHIEETMAQARAEAKVMILNAESYSKTMLTGTEEIVKEETERARNREVATFIHRVVSKTKDDVKNEALQNDYDKVYIKDYFTESKRVNV